MAFWGVEVKPEKPYIHRYNSDEGRLHLSQATLGAGTSTKKCILQCNIGSKRPIYLCSLLPDHLENCALNLEFEEDEEVTLSVIGSHSVHLSGYFVGEYGDEDDGDSDQFEGHCVDSGSESDESMDYDFEDEDEDDDLVDEDDLDMYPAPPVRPSGVIIEEILDDEKPAKERGMSKQTKKKKKHQTSESNDGKSSEKQIVVKSSSQIPVLESEDEDGFPISSPGQRKTGNSNNEEVNDNKVEDAPGKKDTVGLDKANSENSTKLGKRKKKKNAMDAEENIPEANDKSSSLQEANLGNAEQTNEKEKLKEKKKNKKKKRKSENAAVLNAQETTTDKNVSTVDSQTKDEAKPFQVRSFPNGLVIEEVAMGKPDGKKAAPGKKVSVHYVGKLKKNGKIFDSNIGRAPFKFRLGIGQVIKGWDVGVNGMRVGDKRRLTIPPSMGYGSTGAGAAIPPNAWLVFDVELIDVV